MVRPRLRFSLRTLLLFTFLVALALTLWDLTQQYGAPQLERTVPRERLSRVYARTPAPLVVAVTEQLEYAPWNPVTRYYVWFGWSSVKLPYERIEFHVPDVTWEELGTEAVRGADL